jgi:hypothetical protein
MSEIRIVLITPNGLVLCRTLGLHVGYRAFSVYTIIVCIRQSRFR